MSAAYLTYSGKGPAQTVSNQSGSVQVSPHDPGRTLARTCHDREISLKHSSPSSASGAASHASRIRKSFRSAPWRRRPRQHEGSPLVRSRFSHAHSCRPNTNTRCRRGWPCQIPDRCGSWVTADLASLISPTTPAYIAGWRSRNCSPWTLPSGRRTARRSWRAAGGTKRISTGRAAASLVEEEPRRSRVCTTPRSSRCSRSSSSTARLIW